MFLKRNYEGEDYSFHWQLTNDWTDNLEYNEDDETMDTKRRKVRRDDKKVNTENNQAAPSTSTPYHTESQIETISQETQQAEISLPEQNSQRLIGETEPRTVQPMRHETCIMDSSVEYLNLSVDDNIHPLQQVCSHCGLPPVTFASLPPVTPHFCTMNITKRRNLRRGDNKVTTEDNQAAPSTSTPFHTELQMETISQETQQAEISLLEQNNQRLKGEPEHQTVQPMACTTQQETLQPKVQQLTQMLHQDETPAAEAPSQRQTRSKTPEKTLLDQKSILLEALADSNQIERSIKLEQENQQQLLKQLAEQQEVYNNNLTELAQAWEEFEHHFLNWQQEKSRLHKEKGDHDEAAAQQEARIETLESLMLDQEKMENQALTDVIKIWFQKNKEDQWQLQRCLDEQRQDTACTKAALTQAEGKLNNQHLQHEKEKLSLQKDISDAAQAISHKQMMLPDLQQQLCDQEAITEECLAYPRKMRETLSRVQDTWCQVETSLAEQTEMMTGFKAALIQEESTLEKQQVQWQEEKSSLLQTTSILQDLDLKEKEDEQSRTAALSWTCSLQQQIVSMKKKPKKVKKASIWKRIGQFFKHARRT